MAETNVNVNPQGSHTIDKIVDTDYTTFFQAWSNHKESSKLIKINLGADYNVAMILIVNKIGRLAELVDFEIGVGKYSHALQDVKMSCIGVLESEHHGKTSSACAIMRKLLENVGQNNGK